METKKVLDFLEKKVEAKEIKKVNERHSLNVNVIDGKQSYNCTVLIDLYVDLEDNHLYRIEQHIDKNRNYHSIDINEFTNGFF
ncbi:hypothetical protein [Tenacibaculum aiptasiae]|uniref:hypothetical protein n=1 Tax=Tenacibaculum aiptasiae TaxID=426481 RepID=UPI00232D00A2|nr:hypothetical protein [Tenacibaculum aiptasiae]